MNTEYVAFSVQHLCYLGAYEMTSSNHSSLPVKITQVEGDFCLFV